MFKGAEVYYDPDDTDEDDDSSHASASSDYQRSGGPLEEKEQQGEEHLNVTTEHNSDYDAAAATVNAAATKNTNGTTTAPVNGATTTAINVPADYSTTTTNGAVDIMLGDEEDSSYHSPSRLTEDTLQDSTEAAADDAAAARDVAAETRSGRADRTASCESNESGVCLQGGGSMDTVTTRTLEDDTITPPTLLPLPEDECSNNCSAATL